LFIVYNTIVNQTWQGEFQMDKEVLFWIIAALASWGAFFVVIRRIDWAAWRHYHKQRTNTDEFNKDTWEE
jgi:hypothetical protein